VAEPARPYDGRTFIAASSAWAYAHHPAARESWSAALRGGQIATSPVVGLELLYAAPDGDHFDELAADLAHLRDVPITPAVTNAALEALRELSHRGTLRERSISLPDLLIAASAQTARVGVLHYDEDFDVLAEVLEFESRWIAPRESPEQ
jgi:predicted nucleic acid-binding protein